MHISYFLFAYIRNEIKVIILFYACANGHKKKYQKLLFISEQNEKGSIHILSNHQGGGGRAGRQGALEMITPLYFYIGK